MDSEDGSILQHDTRTNTHSTRAQNTLQLAAEVTGIQYHPMMEHIFATSESTGRVCLRDTRMAFGPATQRTCEGVVQEVSIHGSALFPLITLPMDSTLPN